ncbi:ATP-grasp domain-containing protein [Risungbinella massiliensis]|uniref:ATP-grasp domain-containing protein n=1 Tax=Risungbinella massiliensis TaxID=1329796 RepID=UPI0005CBFC57|nr:ATP-grasp domain-containing protein [Risungbinella massiliensis]
MHLIYCADPLDSKKIDIVYQEESLAAERAGFSVARIDLEALIEEGNVTKAVRWVKELDQLETAIYRGWMLKKGQYQQLYEALLQRGLRLINGPNQYGVCHYFPYTYPIIQERTPRSRWIPVDPTFHMEQVHQLLAPFGNVPVIVKDFVKSRKHEWEEACYIPDASNRVQVEKVVQRFLELQGNELNEGIVFREFIELEELTEHPQSGMPLTVEYRLFYLDGECISQSPYWEHGEYHVENVPIEQFQDIAKLVPSRFFTMDIAQCKDGSWMIMELGDGQVAGLPERLEVDVFYKNIAKATI